MKFPRQQFDLAPAARHRSRYEVELEIAHAQHRFLHDGAAAAGESFDARQQFREGKWFHKVVIAAGT
ncbi:MAG: hypothetical protein ACXU9D_02365 [Xanthobacteraceae bacterium]